MVIGDVFFFFLNKFRNFFIFIYVDKKINFKFLNFKKFNFLKNNQTISFSLLRKEFDWSIFFLSLKIKCFLGLNFFLKFYWLNTDLNFIDLILENKQVNKVNFAYTR